MCMLVLFWWSFYSAVTLFSYRLHNWHYLKSMPTQIWTGPFSRRKSNSANGRPASNTRAPPLSELWTEWAEYLNSLLATANMFWRTQQHVRCESINLHFVWVYKSQNLINVLYPSWFNTQFCMGMTVPGGRDSHLPVSLIFHGKSLSRLNSPILVRVSGKTQRPLSNWILCLSEIWCWSVAPWGDAWTVIDAVMAASFLQC